MLIEVVVTPDQDTAKKLFSKPWSLINFRSALRRACDNLEREVRRLAPKATGDYLASIHHTSHEYGDPYRFVCRVYSTHPAADVIEFGAEPHVVPIRAILRWMQAIGMHISNKLTPEDVAFRIQNKIAERGLKAHLVFTDAYDQADAIFQAAVDPILAALGGSATYDVNLRSSGSHDLKWT
jgi:hypothetical protein